MADKIHVCRWGVSLWAWLNGKLNVNTTHFPFCSKIFTFFSKVPWERTAILLFSPNKLKTILKNVLGKSFLCVRNIGGSLWQTTGNLIVFWGLIHTFICLLNVSCSPDEPVVWSPVWASQTNRKQRHALPIVEVWILHWIVSAQQQFVDRSYLQKGKLSVVPFSLLPNIRGTAGLETNYNNTCLQLLKFAFSKQNEVPVEHWFEWRRILCWLCKVKRKEEHFSMQHHWYKIYSCGILFCLLLRCGCLLGDFTLTVVILNSIFDVGCTNCVSRSSVFIMCKHIIMAPILIDGLNFYQFDPCSQLYAQAIGSWFHHSFCFLQNQNTLWQCTHLGFGWEPDISGTQSTFTCSTSNNVPVVIQQYKKHIWFKVKEPGVSFHVAQFLSFIL